METDFKEEAKEFVRFVQLHAQDKWISALSVEDITCIADSMDEFFDTCIDLENLSSTEMQDIYGELVSVERADLYEYVKNAISPSLAAELSEARFVEFTTLQDYFFAKEMEIEGLPIEELNETETESE